MEKKDILFFGLDVMRWSAATHYVMGDSGGGGGDGGCGVFGIILYIDIITN